jgi:hypothetical protein
MAQKKWLEENESWKGNGIQNAVAWVARILM